MKNIFCKIKKYFIKHYIAVLVFLFLLTLIGGAVLSWFTRDISLSIQYFGTSLTLLALIIAIIQINIATSKMKRGFHEFESNKDWNKRYAAITVAKEMKEKMKTDVDLIDKHFNYFNLKPRASITLAEIHKKICILESGEMKRFTDGRGRIDYDNGGHEISRAITNILNGYEYMATCIFQHIFDEKILSALYRGPILNAYYAFYEYIEHYNTEMKPDRNGKVWINFTCLAKKFIEEETEKLNSLKQPDIREPIDYEK